MIKAYTGPETAWAKCPNNLAAFHLSGLLSDISGHMTTIDADRVTVSIFMPDGISAQQQREWIDEAIRRLQEVME